MNYTTYDILFNLLNNFYVILVNETLMFNLIFCSFSVFTFIKLYIKLKIFN